MTHRGVATSVRFLTGHSRASGEADLDESVAAAADPHTTLVVYMGLKMLPTLTAQLLGALSIRASRCASVHVRVCAMAVGLACTVASCDYLQLEHWLCALLMIALLCLAAAGMSARTPAVAVERGTTAEQRPVYARLEDLHGQVTQHQLQSPTLLIIGEVVALSTGWQAAEQSGRSLVLPQRRNRGLSLARGDYRPHPAGSHSKPAAICDR